jgi:outer membrane protein TolC
LQSVELASVYENTLSVLRARKRLNETYVRNGVVLPSVLLRDDGEIARVEDLLRQSGLQAKTAAALLNYLLGRELESPVISDPVLQTGREENLTAGRQREELSRLQEIQRIQELLVTREKALSKPQVGAQLDFGSQNFDFKWGGYALLGISLDIPLWNAGRQNLKVQEAQINADIVGVQANDLEKVLQLEVFSARNALETARSTQQSYRGQLPGARRYFEDLSRRYREGSTLYLELLDAQTQLTNLETQEVISKYEVLVRYAELERALAAYSF